MNQKQLQTKHECFIRSNILLTVYCNRSCIILEHCLIVTVNWHKMEVNTNVKGLSTTLVEKINERCSFERTALIIVPPVKTNIYLMRIEEIIVSLLSLPKKENIFMVNIKDFP